MSSKPTIVFCPGAWHSPKGFRLLRDALHEKGWKTEGVTLPSVGAEPADLGIPDDAKAVRAVIEPLIEEGRSIVLVVHSYGGMVAAPASQGLGYEQRAKKGKKGGIISLLYLTAFVPSVGQSINDLIGGISPTWFRYEGNKVYAETPEQIFYADVNEVLQKKAVADLSHECARAWSDSVDYEPWHDILCLYHACEDDRAIPVFAQDAMAGKFGEDAIIFRSQTSHSPFLSAVGDCVQSVEKAADMGMKRIQGDEVPN